MDDFPRRLAGALNGLATDTHRRELAAEAVTALERMAMSGLLEGVVAIEIFGSFVSGEERPGDVDLLLEYGELDADTVRRVDKLYGPSRRGPVGFVAIDAGPEGEAFRHEYRTETAGRYGAATVRVERARPRPAPAPAPPSPSDS